jgi:PIN domain nuclease of toxin-antitoxin system
LRPAAAAAIRDPARAVFFSAASVWEMELKAAAGKVDLSDGWLDRVDGTAFLELPVTGVEARESAHLPWHHRDPFDRVLVAQAHGHGLQIATRDPWIPAYDVAVMPA